MPKTYGEPVAFLGVPNTELAAAVVMPDEGVVLPDEGALEPLEPLELQAAAVSTSTAAPVTLSNLRGFICASFGDGVYLWCGIAWGVSPLWRPCSRDRWRRAARGARGGRARRP